MKSLFILLLIGLTISSCNNGNGSKPISNTATTGPDTIFTPVIMFFSDNGELRLDYLRRIIKDTTVFKSIDETKAEKEISKDTSYQIGAFDTVRAKNGRPLPDSLGRYSIKLIGYLPFPKTNVLKDFNLDIRQYVPKK